MRIGITNNFFIEIPVNDRTKAAHADYKKMSAMGYTAADDQHVCDPNCYAVKGMSDEEFKSFFAEERRLAEENGIVINQVHGPWPVDDTSEEKRRINKEHMKKCVLAAHYMGAEAMVVHPVMPDGMWNELNAGVSEQLNVEILSEVCDFALPYNVSVCVENLPFPPISLARIENIKALVDKINKPNIGICLDTGHANIFHIDMGEAVKICGEKLVCLHVHDNKGFHDDTHIIPFQGNINWEGFMRALKEIGYKGALSTETGIVGKAKAPGFFVDNILKLNAEVAEYLTTLMV